jgi:predicted acylesterase/phospholipase RssA
MPPPRPATHKSFHIERPLPFDLTALLLQGGGALGSYQAGVYQALTEAGLHPDWVAGISIGAVNAALIAGNPPDKRVERLREFWEAVSTPPLGVPHFKSVEITDELGAMSQRPFSAVPSRAAKHAAESNRDQHSQSIEPSIEPSRPTKAAVLQSPISA